MPTAAASSGGSAPRPADRQLLTNDQSDYRKVSRSPLTGNRSSRWPPRRGRASGSAPIDGLSEPRRISTGRYDGISGIAAVPGGRVLFRTVDNGSNIWIANEDGSGRTQLTTEGYVSWPVATADGRSMIYAREGSGLWQIGLDGQGARSIPGTNGGSVSRDDTGRPSPSSYVSQQAGFEQLSRIPIGGGTAVAMLDYFSTRPSVSPDGKQVAFYFRKDNTSAVVARDHARSTARRRRATLTSRPAAATSPCAGPQTAGRCCTIRPSAIAPTSGCSRSTAVQPRMITRFSDQSVFAFDRSADGKQVLIARGTITRDAFLLKGF